MSTKCSYKYYFVTKCKHTTINHPNIICYAVPLYKNICFKWFKNVRREENKLKQISKARLFCCEDHFLLVLFLLLLLNNIYCVI